MLPSGIGIVHKNANFCDSETDSAEKKNFLREKKSVVRKKEAPVLVLHRIPMKHTECVHMQLLPVLVT